MRGHSWAPGPSGPSSPTRLGMGPILARKLVPQGLGGEAELSSAEGTGLEWVSQDN